MGGKEEYKKLLTDPTSLFDITYTHTKSHALLKVASYFVRHVKRIEREIERERRNNINLKASLNNTGIYNETKEKRPK